MVRYIYIIYIYIHIIIYIYICLFVFLLFFYQLFVEKRGRINWEIGRMGGKLFMKTREKKIARKERKKVQNYYYVGCVHWQLS